MQWFIAQFSTVLAWLYTNTGSLGLAIIAFTLLIRTILFPITVPSIKAQKKMMELKPELDALKTKFKDNPTGLQQAQVELYKKFNINPLSGCLPQLVQLGVLIVLYQTFTKFLAQPSLNGQPLEFGFLWLQLSKPDPFYILPVLAAVSQFVMSFMLTPATETRDVVPNHSKSKKVQKENKEEEGTAQMANMMQQQMLYMMPIMTGVFTATFPSGLGLYWIINNIFSIAQQWYVSGPGGLSKQYQRIKLWLQLKLVSK